jgi:hypothetical protein
MEPNDQNTDGQAVDPLMGDAGSTSQKDIFQNLDSIEVTETAVNPTLVGTEQQFDQPMVVDNIESATGDESTADSIEPTQQQPWQPSDLPEHYKTPEEAYGAAKYFQGQYDESAQQIQDLQHQLDQYGSIKPIADAVISDPSLLTVFADHVRGSSSSGQSTVNPGQPVAGNGQAGTSTESLQQPTAPTKPANMDAYSEDYQAYLDKYNVYLDDKANYQSQLLDQRFAQMDNVMQEQAQAEEARKQQIYRDAGRRSAMDEAMHVHGLTKDQATKFVGDLENGFFNNNIPALMQAWKTANAPTAGDLRQQQAVDAAKQRAGAPRTQLAATQSGQTPVQKTEEQVIGEQLMSEYGPQNNWY